MVAIVASHTNFLSQVLSSEVCNITAYISTPYTAHKASTNVNGGITTTLKALWLHKLL